MSDGHPLPPRRIDAASRVNSVRSCRPPSSATGEAARVSVRNLGLPGQIRACLFDLDGVLTETARLHASAWKEMFDGFLHARAARTGEVFVPFDAVADYEQYVDGKPRFDGVRSFLASRGIVVP